MNARTLIVAMVVSILCFHCECKKHEKDDIVDTYDTKKIETESNLLKAENPNKLLSPEEKEKNLEALIEKLASKYNDVDKKPFDKGKIQNFISEFNNSFNEYLSDPSKEGVTEKLENLKQKLVQGFALEEPYHTKVLDKSTVQGYVHTFTNLSPTQKLFFQYNNCLRIMNGSQELPDTIKIEENNNVTSKHTVLSSLNDTKEYFRATNPFIELLKSCNQLYIDNQFLFPIYNSDQAKKELEILFKTIQSEQATCIKVIQLNVIYGDVFIIKFRDGEPESYVTSLNQNKDSSYYKPIIDKLKSATRYERFNMDVTTYNRMKSSEFAIEYFIRKCHEKYLEYKDAKLIEPLPEEIIETVYNQIIDEKFTISIKNKDVYNVQILEQLGFNSITNSLSKKNRGHPNSYALEYNLTKISYANRRGAIELVDPNELNKKIQNNFKLIA